MKTRIFFFAMLSSLLLMTSCIGYIDNSITGNGDVQTEIREVGNFKGIEAASGLNVFVEFGEFSHDVEVIADENLHDYIITEVNDGILKIKSRRNIRRAESKDVFVKAGDIESIEVSSAADFIGENLLVSDDLDIEVSSAGDLDLEVEADEIIIEVSSSGSAKLKGKTRRLIAEVSSAGNLSAYELIAEEGNIEASSAGDARVHVTKKLRAEASSAGSVKYEGDPEERNTERSSAGSVSGR